MLRVIENIGDPPRHGELKHTLRLPLNPVTNINGWVFAEPNAIFLIRIGTVSIAVDFTGFV